MTRLSSIIALTIIPLVSGCNSTVDGNGFFEIDGTVTWNGEPLDNGWIIFRAKDETSRNVSSPIKDGGFSVKIQEGEKIVEVTAEREVSGKFTRGASGEEVPAKESYIPAKYNTNSELKVDIAYPPSETLIFKLSDT